MGTSYDGIYFYGLVFDNDGTENGWPDDTQEAFDAVGAEDFDGWLEKYLEVEPSWVDGRRVRDYDEFHEELKQKSIATFGVEFEVGFAGYVDYAANYICPKGAESSEWRCGRVPEWPPELVEKWRVACVKLAAVLPGSDGKPGLYFGCSVG